MTKDEMIQIRDMVSELFEVNMKGIDKRFDAVDKRFDAVEDRLDKLENEQVRQGLLLENEVFPSLQLLAEGHGDVIRRLDKMDADIEDLKEGLLATQIKVAGK